MERQTEYVLRTVEERGVRFVQLWFTDVLGVAKSFHITPAELENAMEEGMTFDGSAIDGFSRVQESDVLAMPDPKTFQLLPYMTDEAPVARVVCDIVNLDGAPFEGDPRQVLRRALEKARSHGFSFFVAPELEYFYFTNPPGTVRDGMPPTPLDNGSFFELTTNDLATRLRRQTVVTLEDMGIPVEYSQHEDAPSQHEIDLRYTDALTMADTVMTVRTVVKEIAAQHGILATFMPKPLFGVQGSGMHTHMSLFEGGNNAFFDENGDHQLSDVARSFIAGLLLHAPAICAITNQWVNSYKRLIVGYEAPVYVCWARNNRSALIRLPPTKAGKRDSTRIEFRAPDSAANPYLAFAACLGAGLAGVEAGAELPPEAAANLYELSNEERLAEGIGSLPGSLSDAVDTMERSELVAEILGEHVFEWFVRNKRAEWAEYKAQVTPFELRRYLTSL
ncbi:MAG TPA: type I glutamate--ammonia ligase [Acidimicrobiales bacterium]|jgi:glutamine synthetase|nr:type I glutamate--ammonia ligase [Acidimicrobiales bacterium]